MIGKKYGTGKARSEKSCLENLPALPEFLYATVKPLSVSTQIVKGQDPLYNFVHSRSTDGTFPHFGYKIEVGFCFLGETSIRAFLTVSLTELFLGMDIALYINILL
jgi:hypothetical protein